MKKIAIIALMLLASVLSFSQSLVQLTKLDGSTMFYDISEIGFVKVSGGGSLVIFRGSARGIEFVESQASIQSNTCNSFMLLTASGAPTLVNKTQVSRVSRNGSGSKLFMKDGYGDLNVAEDYATVAAQAAVPTGCGGSGGGSTNLTFTPALSNGTVNSDTGGDAVIPGAVTSASNGTGGNAGLASNTDKYRIDNAVLAIDGGSDISVIYSTGTNPITKTANLSFNNVPGNTIRANGSSSSGPLGNMVMSPSTLAGRGSTGNVSPITLGSGLSMTGTVLSSTVTSVPVWSHKSCSTGTSCVSDSLTTVATGTVDTIKIGFTDDYGLHRWFINSTTGNVVVYPPQDAGTVIDSLGAFVLAPGNIAEFALSSVGVGTYNWVTISEYPVSGGGGTISQPAGQVVYGTGASVASSANLFWNAANNRLGIGTSTPSAPLEVSSTAVDGASIMRVSGSLLASPVTQNDGVIFNITGAGSSTSSVPRALLVTLQAGYTGSSNTLALQFVNNSSGTGFNMGSSGVAGGAGKNIGATGYAAGGTTNIGGYFALQNGPAGAGTQSAALIADNAGGISSPIFLAKSNTTEVFRIASTGNVGIGTNAPASKLDVEGGVSIGATYSGTTAAPTNGAIIEGNVGIGTNNPGSKLHVVGNLRVNGDFRPDDLPGTSGQLLTSAGPGLPPTWTNAGGGGNLSGTGNAGSGGVQRLAFWKTGTTLDDNALMVVDTVNVRLGIGTATPGTKLQVLSSDATDAISGRSDNASAIAVTGYSANGRAGLFSGGGSQAALAVRALTSLTGNVFQWQDNTGTGLGGITPLGSVGIGTTTPIAKLNIIAPTNTEDDNKVLSIDRPNAGLIAFITDRGKFQIANGPSFYPSAPNGVISRSENGMFVGNSSSAAEPTGFSSVMLGRPIALNWNPTTGAAKAVDIISKFNPASGNATFTSLNINPTIDQNASATGNIIGLDYNPTLTTLGTGTHWAAMFRSGKVDIGITTNSSGKLNIESGVNDLVGLNIISNNTTNNCYSINLSRASTGVQNAFNFSTVTTPKWFLGVDNDATEDFMFYSWAANKHIYKAFNTTGDIGFGSNFNLLYLNQTVNKVGIGTQSPATNLEVKSATGADVSLSLNTTDVSGSGAAGGLRFANNGTNKWGIIYSANTYFGLYDYTVSDYRMYVNNSGQIGFGNINPSAKVEITSNLIGVGQANTYGLVLANNTSATLGNQQMSPPVRWRANGWKTDATAGSQTVDFIADVLPVQGTAAPTGNWTLKSSINGGSYTTILSANTGGDLIVSNNVYASRVYSNFFRDASSGNTWVSLTGTSPSQTLAIGNSGVSTTHFQYGNFGIGTTSPGEKLDLVGNFKLTSGAFMPGNNAGTAGQVLTSGGAGVVPTWSSAGTGTIKGTVGATRIPYASGLDTLASSANFTYGSGRVTSNSSSVAGFRTGYDATRYADFGATSLGDAYIQTNLALGTGRRFGINTTSPSATVHASNPNDNDADLLVLDHNSVTMSDGHQIKSMFAFNGTPIGKIAAVKDGTGFNMNFYSGSSGAVNSSPAIAVNNVSRVTLGSTVATSGININGGMAYSDVVLSTATTETLSTKTWTLVIPTANATRTIPSNFPQGSIIYITNASGSFTVTMAASGADSITGDLVVASGTTGMYFYYGSIWYRIKFQ